MKTKSIPMIAAAAAIIFALSCTSDHAEEPQANQLEIRLRSDCSNMAPTRAATDIHNSYFDYVPASGETPAQVETIHVEILDAQVDQDNNVHTLTPSPVRIPYTFASSSSIGGMAPIGTPPYFPSSGNKVNIYAYYPSTVTSTTESFTVATDQSSDNNYKASDLMYAEPVSNPVARTSEAIALPFAHKLSKIVVQLQTEEQGIEISDFIGATVTMKAMISTPITNACVATSQTWTSADAATVNMGEVEGSNYDAGIFETAAIVVPQIIAANSANVFTITLLNGAVYHYTPKAALSIEAGKVHEFVFTLSRTALSVSTSIADWGTGTSDTPSVYF